MRFSVIILEVQMLHVSQFSSVTVCPNKGFPSRPWGFIEDYFDLLDPQSDEVFDLFKFIPTFMLNARRVALQQEYRYTLSSCQ